MASRKGRSGGDPLAHLEQEGPRPVYAVDGDERLFVVEAVETIRSKSLGSSSPDFNQDIFNLKDTSISRVIDAASTLPAFAPVRVVLLHGADKINASDSEPLLRYLGDPSPTTVLILVGEKFDARTKLYKALQKAGATLRFDRPREREMPAILRRRAEMAGIRIEDAAIRAIVDALGMDVGAAVGTLEKLALYVGPSSGATVTAGHVEELVSHAKEESIFLLADAVGTKDTRLALETLHSMMTGTRGHPLGLLGMVARHWRRLAEARSKLDAGVSRTEMQSSLGLPPFVVDKLLSQAKQQSRVGLIAGLRAIAEADQALKGGKLAGERVMERLVLDLTRDPRRAV